MDDDRGFVDGIPFHQMLQTHNMLSAILPRVTLVNAEADMFWDGLFHAFTWIMSALGLALLWRAFGRVDVPNSTKTFIGSLILGWGLFSLVEGIIDHQILGSHHLYDTATTFSGTWRFAAQGSSSSLSDGRLFAAGAVATTRRRRTGRTEE
jgi:uncharacterized membrane protein